MASAWNSSQFFDYSPTLPNFLPGSQVVNAPANGALIALPSNIGISEAQIERERINGMVTIPVGSGREHHHHR